MIQTRDSRVQRLFLSDHVPIIPRRVLCSPSIDSTWPPQQAVRSRSTHGTIASVQLLRNDQGTTDGGEMGRWGRLNGTHLNSTLAVLPRLPLERDGASLVGLEALLLLESLAGRSGGNLDILVEPVGEWNRVGDGGSMVGG